MTKTKNKLAILLGAASLLLTTSCGGDPAVSTSPFSLSDAPDSSFITLNGCAALTDGSSALAFSKDDDGYGLALYEVQANSVLFTQSHPLRLSLRGASSGIGIITYQFSSVSGAYETVQKTNYGYLACGTLTSDEGSVFAFADAFSLNQGVLQVSRQVSVSEVKGTDQGFATAFSFLAAESATDYQGYDYFIPGILYKNTDYLAGDAIMGNLAVDQSFVKETRTPFPMIYLRSHASGRSLALVHYDPQISTGGVNGGGNAGEINAAFLYGSFGYGLQPNVSAGFNYPCFEGPSTYDSGQGWARRFHPVQKGFAQTYQLGMIVGTASDYNSDVVASFKKAYLFQKKTVAKVSMDTIYDQGMEILEKEYKEFRYNGQVVAAGVPWSMNVPNGDGVVYTFQMGFVGQQIACGYHLYHQGYKEARPALSEQGKTILNFWTGSNFTSSYFPSVWWDPANNSSGGNRRDYPCFLRCMIDGMEGLVDAYLESVAQGDAQSRWLGMLNQFGGNLLAKQNSDGSFYRCYRTNGNVETDTTNPVTQGTSRFNTPIAIRFLKRMYLLTSDERYKTAALAAAEYAYTELYQKLGKFIGGTPDHTNTIDKEAAIYAMYGFQAAYELSQDARYLAAAEFATIMAFSFVYTYDFAVPANNSAAEVMNPFAKGNTSGFSLISTGASGADNFAAYTFYATYKEYLYTSDPFYREAALLLENNTKYATDFDGRLGFRYRGLLPEASSIADFSFSSVGCWLAWCTMANIEPILQMKRTFGFSEIEAVTGTVAEQKTQLAAFLETGKVQ